MVKGAGTETWKISGEVSGGLLTPHGLRRGGITAEDEVKYGLGFKEAGARSEAASRTRSLTSTNVTVSRFP